MKNKLEKRLLLNIYDMLIHPYITYCNVFWGKGIIADNEYVTDKLIPVLYFKFQA